MKNLIPQNNGLKNLILPAAFTTILIVTGAMSTVTAQENQDKSPNGQLESTYEDNNPALESETRPTHYINDGEAIMAQRGSTIIVNGKTTINFNDLFNSYRDIEIIDSEGNEPYQIEITDYSSIVEADGREIKIVFFNSVGQIKISVSDLSNPQLNPSTQNNTTVVTNYGIEHVGKSTFMRPEAGDVDYNNYDGSVKDVVIHNRTGRNGDTTILNGGILISSFGPINTFIFVDTRGVGYKLHIENTPFNPKYTIFNKDDEIVLIFRLDTM